MDRKIAVKKESRMSLWKRIALFCVALALAAASTPCQVRGADEVFKGVIADSQCALNVHSLSKSHKEMLQDKTIGDSPSDCVWHCVKDRGGRFVLQDKENVYRLDDQTLGRQFAAQRVQITGTLDAQTKTIHVKSIALWSDVEKPAAVSK
jgi:hypothetical protein